MATETTFIITVLLPCLLAFIIFGLGLSLDREDFKRISKTPTAVFTGLTLKIVLLPAMAFLICLLFRLEPALAVGMMILAGCPGGVMANVFANLAKGDVAFSLTLTAIDTLIASVTLPITIGFSLYYFQGDHQTVGLQISELVKIFLILFFPVTLGMYCRAKFPVKAAVLERYIKFISIAFLIFLIVAVVSKERQLLIDNAFKIGGVIILFNFLCLLFGFLGARLLGLTRPQIISVTMASGIQGTALGITVATSVLNNVTYAVPAAFFSLTMYLMAAATVALNNRLRAD